MTPKDFFKKLDVSLHKMETEPGISAFNNGKIIVDASLDYNGNPAIIYAIYRNEYFMFFRTWSSVLSVSGETAYKDMGEHLDCPIIYDEKEYSKLIKRIIVEAL